MQIHRRRQVMGWQRPAAVPARCHPRLRFWRMPPRAAHHSPRGHPARGPGCPDLGTSPFEGACIKMTRRLIDIGPDDPARVALRLHPRRCRSRALPEPGIDAAVLVHRICSASWEKATAAACSAFSTLVRFVEFSSASADYSWIRCYSPCPHASGRAVAGTGLARNVLGGSVGAGQKSQVMALLGRCAQAKACLSAR